MKDTYTEYQQREAQREWQRETGYQHDQELK